MQDFNEIKHYCQLSKQMETIIEFSTDGIYVVDGNGITLMVNSAYEQITGFRREELIGRHMEELVREGYFDQSVSLLVLKQKQRISMLQTIGGKKRCHRHWKSSIQRTRRHRDGGHERPRHLGTEQAEA
ncbi:PAS domain S-box protein [Geobacillus stearothermophilus]|nr:PAS domain S-box protein [Geobacillus stearothermophilus]